MNSKDEAKKCDFMRWDVPGKDDCPVCGQTMFKKAGRGFKKPFCINPACSNFLPEEKRGYHKKTTSEAPQEESAPAEETAEKTAPKKAAARKTPAAKKTTTTKKTTAAKKTAAKKPAAKKTAAKTAEE